MDFADLDVLNIMEEEDSDMDNVKELRYNMDNFKELHGNVVLE